jgi:hypothetical protein
MENEKLLQKSNEAEISPERIASKVGLLMIKPENMEKSLLFPAILKNYGFKTEKYCFTLDQNMIDKLYPDMQSWNEKIRQATVEHLLNKEIIVLLVENDGSRPDANITEELFRIRGDKTNPLQCNPASLRFVFGGKEIKLDEENSYWQNGLHCPRDPKELINNLEAFDLLNVAKEKV